MFCHVPGSHSDGFRRFEGLFTGRGDGGGSDPLFARNRARAGARVGAGAVRAPDCPRARVRSPSTGSRQAAGAVAARDEGTEGTRLKLSSLIPSSGASRVSRACPEPVEGDGGRRLGAKVCHGSCLLSCYGGRGLCGRHRRQCGGGGRLRSSRLLVPSGAAGSLCRARFAGVRARASAPARFARLIARARRRTHVSRRFLRGCSTTAPLGRAAPRKAAPESASLGAIIPQSAICQDQNTNKIKNTGNCLCFARGRGGKGGHDGRACRRGCCAAPLLHACNRVRKSASGGLRP